MKQVRVVLRHGLAERQQGLHVGQVRMSTQGFGGGPTHEGIAVPELPDHELMKPLRQSQALAEDPQNMDEDHPVAGELEMSQ